MVKRVENLVREERGRHDKASKELDQATPRS